MISKRRPILLMLAALMLSMPFALPAVSQEGDGLTPPRSCWLAMVSVMHNGQLYNFIGNANSEAGAVACAKAAACLVLYPPMEPPVPCGPLEVVMISTSNMGAPDCTCQAMATEFEVEIIIGPPAPIDKDEKRVKIRVYAANKDLAMKWGEDYAIKIEAFHFPDKDYESKVSVRSVTVTD